MMIDYRLNDNTQSILTNICEYNCMDKISDLKIFFNDYIPLLCMYMILEINGKTSTLKYNLLVPKSHHEKYLRFKQNKSLKSV